MSPSYPCLCGRMLPGPGKCEMCLIKEVEKKEGLSHEEIHKIEPVSMAFCSADKVKVGKKSLVFSSQGYRQSIKFEKGIAHTRHPDFQITVMEEVNLTAKCSLGHDHVTGKKETKWGQIQLSWEQAEVLMDWFSTGNWKVIREQSKIEKVELEKLRSKLRDRT